jgi:hypothetical protein
VPATALVWSGSAGGCVPDTAACPDGFLEGHPVRRLVRWRAALTGAFDLAHEFWIESGGRDGTDRKGVRMGDVFVCDASDRP